jgi:uncharacterized protein YyaL (SSP411 family)
MHDNATPCGNAIMATVLVRLGRLCGKSQYLDTARNLLQAASPIVSQSAMAAGQWLVALDELLGPAREIVIVGEPGDADTIEVLRAVRQKYAPNTIGAFRGGERETTSVHLDALFAGREAAPGALGVYICHDSVCESPLHDVREAVSRINEMD